jgi:hypothetical protein
MAPWYEDAYARSVCLTFLESVATRVYVGPQYRVSLLSHKSSPELVEPVFRFLNGKAQRVAGQHMQFQKGAPVAGLAWEKPQRAFILELPEFKRQEDLLNFYTAHLAFSRDQTARLLSGTMLPYRSILCIGLHETAADIPLVMSVDSVTPNAFVNDVGGDAFVTWGGKLLAEINRARPHLQVILKGRHSWQPDSR